MRPDYERKVYLSSTTSRDRSHRFEEAPTTVPPLFLKPTQGDPVLHMYGTLRPWAAERVGVQYSHEDQCWDYFRQD